MREGDGEAITDFWKTDMVLFWGRRHPKYFIIGHHLLRGNTLKTYNGFTVKTFYSLNNSSFCMLGIEGFYVERVREDLKWNRVANLSGQPGGNLGLDLVNELQNNEFKGIYILF